VVSFTLLIFKQTDSFWCKSDNFWGKMDNLLCKPVSFALYIWQFLMKSCFCCKPVSFLCKPVSFTLRNFQYWLFYEQIVSGFCKKTHSMAVSVLTIPWNVWQFSLQIFTNLWILTIFKQSQKHSPLPLRPPCLLWNLQHLLLIFLKNVKLIKVS
jgi:hypothetical protein